MDVIYHNLDGRLPHNIILLQDNCQRECKNGKILAAVCKLKILGVVDRMTLAYPVKGHTHGPLDACGGQAVVKCSHSEFSSAMELTGIYDASFYSSCCDTQPSKSNGAFCSNEVMSFRSHRGGSLLVVIHFLGPKFLF